ncbi:MAG TPA: 3,4-dihydroxyphenylacetate 2,3-dioxygenase [Chloroflexota bacterium]|nr:3,4-dihydroxyphenylacetate 2,3-dioxygenase [Chloroflexota bacterium]
MSGATSILHNPPQPSIHVLRAGHVEFLVTDLARARHFYVTLLGFVETEATEEALYLRCLEERSHHSLVLRLAREPGAGHIAFRVASPEDLPRVAALAEPQALPYRWVDGEERGQGTAIRLQDPSGLPLEFYHQMDPAPRLLQRYDLHGPVQIMRLDHYNCQVRDVAAAVAWYQRHLGFRVSEYTVTEESGGEERLWGAWLHRKQTVHDLALMSGIGPRLHHAGFWLPDPMAVLRACDVLAAAGYHRAIERGPGRHGLSNALFLYLRDPDGNRIELYANDYLTADPDAEPIRWTLDDPRRATFWGHAAPACWFEEAMAVQSISGEGFMAQGEPPMRDRPDHVT